MIIIIRSCNDDGFWDDGSHYYYHYYYYYHNHYYEYYYVLHKHTSLLSTIHVCKYAFISISGDDLYKLLAFYQNVPYNIMRFIYVNLNE